MGNLLIRAAGEVDNQTRIKFSSYNTGMLVIFLLQSPYESFHRKNVMKNSHHVVHLPIISLTFAMKMKANNLPAIRKKNC